LLVVLLLLVVMLQPLVHRLFAVLPHPSGNVIKLFFFVAEDKPK